MKENSEKITIDTLKLLFDWYQAGHRDLPWRRQPADYYVWLSEIMLQQTRVEAVKPYFTAFTEAFPTISALARASEDAVLKQWEGLGYYSRAKNLHKAAKYLVQEYNGHIPADYHEILSMPGVGSYTAGAIASICYDLPYPAVDGNVLRVCSRILASEADIASPNTKKMLEAELGSLYQSEAFGEAGLKSGGVNQALMELGACVCLPNGVPNCTACPVNAVCLAYSRNLTASIPVKSPKKARKVIEKTVFIISSPDSLSLLMGQRKDKGLLEGLWEFPNIDIWLDETEVCDWVFEQLGVKAAICGSDRQKHIFTHIEWHMRVYYLQMLSNPEKQPDGYLFIERDALKKDITLPTAFSKLLR